MATLGVNIDHIATLRQARLGVEPSVLEGALICEKAGVNAITMHLREDRRHIQDYDIEQVKNAIKINLNLEMAATEEIQQIAIKTMPYSCTLVPEKRQELTTEGGLEVANNSDYLKNYIRKLTEKNIIVSLFIDPEESQIIASKEVGAQYIEFHTGKYAELFSKNEQETEFQKIKKSVELAHSLGLGVNAGHGLNYENVAPIANLPYMEELNIGHSIISRAVFVGLEQAVLEMKSLIS